MSARWSQSEVERLLVEALALYYAANPGAFLVVREDLPGALLLHAGGDNWRVSVTRDTGLKPRHNEGKA